MSSDINRLRRLWSRKRVGPSGREGSSPPEEALLDPWLSFVPSSGEKWTYRDESGILIDGFPVGELVDEGGEGAGVLGGLLQGVSDYQQYVWLRGGRGHEKFNAAVAAIEGKIQGRLACLYEGLTGGVKFESDGDDFWVNNVSIPAVLGYYKRNPSENVRIYLLGLRDKLGLILGRSRSSTRYDGVEQQARELYEEISVALENASSPPYPRLGPGSGVA